MAIELRNITFSYKKIPIIKDFSFMFESGLYFIKGKNGSGKTTLSKLICGLLKPQQGEIIIDNENIKKKRPAQIAKNLGYLFQNPDMQLFAPTVFEELSFIFEIEKQLTEDIKEKINHLLKTFDLLRVKEQFPLTLSVGEKQRLALATIFIRDVNTLILDEPFASIDQKCKEFLAGLINNFVRQGKTAIVITHGDQPNLLKPKENIVLGGQNES